MRAAREPAISGRPGIAPRLEATAAAWRAAAVPAIVVEVLDARGSAPRGAGTRMLVSRDACDGTIGGGHLEWKAIERARRMLLEGAGATVAREHYALGPSLGQCCGGAVTLGFEPLSAAHLAAWPRAQPRFRLQLYGAGHVGHAIARLLAGIDCEVDWIDERDAQFPAGVGDRPVTGCAPPGGPVGAPWPAHVRKVAVDGVEAEVDDAAPGTFFLVLTHRHDLDLRIGERILARADFGFFGLIGSQTKRAKFRAHFARRGIADAVIDRMTCPIGVPGIEGKEPEVIAVGVVAQLLQRAPVVR